MAAYKYPRWFPKSLIGALGALAAVVILIAASDPRSQSLAAIPVFVWLFLLLIFGFILYGIHMSTLVITIEQSGLRVKSIYINRYVAFHDVGSVRDLNNGNWHTLDVQTKSGKPILYTSNTGFPDYESLVDAIKNGVSEANKSKNKVADEKLPSKPADP
jgi:hypothetical protein